jgi:hypothetical protein
MPTILAIAAFLALSGSAPQPQVASHCFDVHTTAWSPPLSATQGPGGDSVFITLPPSIVLTNISLGVFENRKSYKVVAARGLKATKYAWGSWSPEGDKIKLVWGDGYSGMEATLTRTMSGLEGPAKTYWDFPRTVQESLVTAKEVHCTRLATGG